jgi:glycosyltransferase involved in cell wall biosynthesis
MRRFYTSISEDGWRVALAKARIYTTMRWHGSSHSALDHVHTNHVHFDANADDKYLQGIWQQLAQGEAFNVSAPAKLDKRRSIALVGDLNLPQCRKYRVEQLAAFWQTQGVTCEFAHYQDLPRVTRIMSQATHLMEYRLQSTPLGEMLRYEARRLRLPVLYDIDDPLFSVSAYETYGNMAALDPWMKAHFLSEAPKYLAMMNGADMLSMSTPGLAAHAALYSARPVHVRRNFADAETLDAGTQAMHDKPAPDGVFRCAFSSGSQGHEVDLMTIVPALEAFVAEAPERGLTILGYFKTSHLPKALADRTDIVPFSTYDRYLTALAHADVAIMPLADDLFNQCKSAVRLIDASAVAVPSIVGTVGDLEQVVVDGKTGHVARNSQDWLSVLRAMAADRRQTAAMGQAARLDLEQRWSESDAPHIIAPEILDWVRG